MVWCDMIEIKFSIFRTNQLSHDDMLGYNMKHHIIETIVFYVSLHIYYSYVSAMQFLSVSYNLKQYSLIVYDCWYV